MARKRYINRIKKPKENSKDDWTHVTGIDGTDTRIEIADTMDVQDRSIFIRGEEQKPLTVTEAVQEELKETGQETRHANQYVRYVNAILDNRLAKLEKIKKKKAAFDEDIDALQPEHLKNFEKLTKLPFSELNSKEIARVLKTLSQEKSMTQTQLEHFKNKVKAIQERLLQQDKKVQEINEKLQEKVVQEQEKKEKRSVEIIQEELQTLGEIYGMKKLSEAINMLKQTRVEK